MSSNVFLVLIQILDFNFFWDLEFCSESTKYIKPQKDKKKVWHTVKQPCNVVAFFKIWKDQTAPLVTLTINLWSIKQSIKLICSYTMVYVNIYLYLSSYKSVQYTKSVNNSTTHLDLYFYLSKSTYNHIKFFACVCVHFANKVYSNHDSL